MCGKNVFEATYYSILQVTWKDGYEPYIVGVKKTMPVFNEAFIGRIRDKIHHALMVHALGYGLNIWGQSD